MREAEASSSSVVASTYGKAKRTLAVKVDDGVAIRGNLIVGSDGGVARKNCIEGNWKTLLIERIGGLTRT